MLGLIDNGREQTQEAAEELEALTGRSREKLHHGRKMACLFNEPDAEVVRTAARILNHKKTVDFMKDQHKRYAKRLVCGLNDLTSRYKEASTLRKQCRNG